MITENGDSPQLPTDKGRPRLSFLTVSNLAVLGLGVLTPIAAIVTYVLTQQVERGKDRELERYKIDARSQIADARARAEEARAQAAKAGVEAANAKLETAKISERLASTQERLDVANSITALSKAQLNIIAREMKKVDLSDSQLVLAAGNDLQSQRRLVQISEALLKAGVTLGGTASGPFTPLIEQAGDVTVNYWAEERHATADLIARAFRNGKVDARVYKLPADPTPGADQSTKNLIVVAMPVRKPQTFRGR